jgi:hypothetical protein
MRAVRRSGRPPARRTRPVPGALRGYLHIRFNIVNWLTLRNQVLAASPNWVLLRCDNRADGEARLAGVAHCLPVADLWRLNAYSGATFDHPLSIIRWYRLIQGARLAPRPRRHASRHRQERPAAPLYRADAGVSNRPISGQAAVFQSAGVLLGSGAWSEWLQSPVAPNLALAYLVPAMITLSTHLLAARLPARRDPRGRKPRQPNLAGPDRLAGRHRFEVRRWGGTGPVMFSTAILRRRRPSIVGPARRSMTNADASGQNLPMGPAVPHCRDLMASASSKPGTGTFDFHAMTDDASNDRIHACQGAHRLPRRSARVMSSPGRASRRRRHDRHRQVRPAVCRPIGPRDRPQRSEPETT